MSVSPLFISELLVSKVVQSEVAIVYVLSMFVTEKRQSRFLVSLTSKKLFASNEYPKLF